MDTNDSQLEYLRDFDPQTVDEVPTGTRFAIAAFPTEIGPNGGIVPSIVYENISGHFPLRGNGDHARPWEWGDYDTAVKLAAEYNLKLGLTADEASNIVLSSWRQHHAQQDD